VPVTTVEVYPDATTPCYFAVTDVPPTHVIVTSPCQAGPMPTLPDGCFDSTEPDITIPCGTVVPTAEFDPNSNDPVYSSDGPVCTPGTGDGIECALIDIEQQYSVAPGDSLVSIARRYRLSVDTLVAYNEWPDGVDHLLLVDDIVLIPPWTPNGGVTPATSTPTTTTSTTTTTTQP
jgi:LysM domain